MRGEFLRGLRYFRDPALAKSRANFCTDQDREGGAVGEQHDSTTSPVSTLLMITDILSMALVMISVILSIALAMISVILNMPLVRIRVVSIDHGTGRELCHDQYDTGHDQCDAEYGTDD